VEFRRKIVKSKCKNSPSIILKLWKDICIYVLRYWYLTEEQYKLSWAAIYRKCFRQIFPVKQTSSKIPKHCNSYCLVRHDTTGITFLSVTTLPTRTVGCWVIWPSN
jgi:hypothetical protein